MKAQNIPSQAASDFFEAAYETVDYLYSRWQDEKGYEQISDYRAPLIPIAERFGVTIERMTGRPFGCIFKVDDRTYLLARSARQYSYKRTA